MPKNEDGRTDRQTAFQLYITEDITEEEEEEKKMNWTEIFVAVCM